MNSSDNLLEECGDTDTEWRSPFGGSAVIALGCLVAQTNPPGLEYFSSRRFAPFVSESDNYDWNATPGIVVSEMDLESFADESNLFKLQSIPLYLKSQLNHLSLPRAWVLDGTEEPSPDCLTWSLQVLCRLFDNYGLIPYKIVPSKEGGVFAAYKHPTNQNILRIEVDNELDVVAVVSDGQSVLESGLLEDDDSERSLIECFNRQLA